MVSHTTTALFLAAVVASVYGLPADSTLVSAPAQMGGYPQSNALPAQDAAAKADYGVVSAAPAQNATAPYDGVDDLEQRRGRRQGRRGRSRSRRDTDSSDCSDVDSYDDDRRSRSRSCDSVETRRSDSCDSRASSVSRYSGSESCTDDDESSVDGRWRRRRGGVRRRGRRGLRRIRFGRLPMVYGPMPWRPMPSRPIRRPRGVNGIDETDCEEDTPQQSAYGDVSTGVDHSSEQPSAYGGPVESGYSPYDQDRHSGDEYAADNEYGNTTGVNGYDEFRGDYGGDDAYNGNDRGYGQQDNTADYGNDTGVNGYDQSRGNDYAGDDSAYGQQDNYNDYGNDTGVNGYDQSRGNDYNGQDDIYGQDSYGQDDYANDYGNDADSSYGARPQPRPRPSPRPQPRNGRSYGGAPRRGGRGGRQNQTQDRRRQYSQNEYEANESGRTLDVNDRRQGRLSVNQRHADEQMYRRNGSERAMVDRYGQRATARHDEIDAARREADATTVRYNGPNGSVNHSQRSGSEDTFSSDRHERTFDGPNRRAVERSYNTSVSSRDFSETSTQTRGRPNVRF